MTRFQFNAALAFGLLLSAPALAEGREAFRHDGSTYEYQVTDVGKSHIIEGVQTPGGRTFRLRVVGSWVYGVVDGADVSFSLRDVKPVAGKVVLAVPAPTIAAR